ncbi:MAG: hypothetical protein OXI83_18970 [Gemmatimonadota bacterium]|nr:hypothetical protein [Gemmatimonadota bacterium]
MTIKRNLAKKDLIELLDHAGPGASTPESVLARSVGVDGALVRKLLEELHREGVAYQVPRKVGGHQWRNWMISRGALP